MSPTGIPEKLTVAMAAKMHPAAIQPRNRSDSSWARRDRRK